ncbi:MAG TPA: lysylphosphatidylglycerol synthase transmembrane domain-containing protein [Vicinamibacterales bacterium]|nr:lysylphosphatidylglycerol synthase transmembrane domain-containing protein [Vicinamibacterales bacterium]
MPPPSRSPIPWHALLIAGLTLGLLWWFFHNLNFHEVWRAIESAHLGLVGAAVLVTLVTYVVRALRWQALLKPIGNATFRNTFRTTVMGFTATFLLPGRIGEVLRPYLLARAEGFNTASALATVIIERVMDLASVLLLFGWLLLTAGMDVGREVELAGAASAVLAVVAVGILVAGAGHPERLGRWAGGLVKVLPVRARDAVQRFVHTFAEGLAVMRRPAPLIVAFVLSVLLWLSIGLGIWLTSRAFDLTFSFVGSFLVVMFLVVGVSLPTPGGVGGFHKMYQFAVTTFFGAAAEAAAACAIVLHAVSFVPISIMGLIFMAQDGLTLGGLRKMKSTAEAAEAAK